MDGGGERDVVGCAAFVGSGLHLHHLREQQNSVKTSAVSPAKVSTPASGRSGLSSEPS